MRVLALVLLASCAAKPQPSLATLGPADRPCEAKAPPRFVRAVRDAELRWRALGPSAKPALEAAFAKARDDSTGKPLGPEETGETTRCVARWSVADERFEVSFTRKLATWSSMTSRKVGCSKRYPNRHSEQGGCAPRLQLVQYRREYSATDGLIVRFDALGAPAGESWQPVVATPATPATLEWTVLPDR